jgi:thymidylate kinase
VVVEGIDGGGKSTLVRTLAARHSGTAIVVKNLPSWTPTTLLLRAFPSSLGMLWAISRDQRGRLNRLSHRYDLVLQDRGLWSEATHLPNARRRWTRRLAEHYTKVGSEPDLRILLDVDPDEAYRRIVARDGREPREFNSQPDTLRERAGLYRELAEKAEGECLVLDGRDQEETAAAAARAIVLMKEGKI